MPGARKVRGHLRPSSFRLPRIHEISCGARDRKRFVESRRGNSNHSSHSGNREKQNMKISFFGLEDWEKQYVESRGAFESIGAETEFYKEALAGVRVARGKAADAISVFIDSSIDETTLK